MISLRTLLFSLTLSLFWSSTSLYSYESERITNFESAIQVHPDASLTVKETITVISTGDRIRRGITRSFPTRYKKDNRLNYITAFDVIDVRHNGNPVNFHLEKVSNGTHIYIGEKHRRIQPGTHTYTITYKTDRQLGFFKDHDELYWNVTGNDTIFPIERVVAKVHLPHDVPKDSTRAEAYTGFFGRKGTDYKTYVDDEGVVYFETTRPLRPHEGMSIVASWPKGFITPPSLTMQLSYFFRDNLAFLLLLLGFFLVVFFYRWSYRAIRKDVREGTVIPRFHPPEHLSPGGLGYIMRMKYDGQLFSATVVDMAIKGLLIISSKKQGWSAREYTLERHNNPEKGIFGVYKKIFDIIFHPNKKLKLSQENREKIIKATEKLKKFYDKKFENGYFKSVGYYIAHGVIASLIICCLPLFFDLNIDYALWVMFGVAFIIINLFYINALPAYTQKGQELKEEIEGFKLFLGTTETERLKVIGTPPVKTPELYEKYLPYAMALGVEDAWTQQFTPVFARLAKEKTPYHPRWYRGGLYKASDIGGFSRSLNSGLSNTITASSRVPGSSSGSGGRGSSGGGGGGGGVGGW